MEEAVEHGGDRSAVTKKFSPVLHRTVRSQKGAGPLIAPHDDLEEVFGGGGWELAHTEIIDDEQRYGGEELHVLFTSAIDGGFGDFLQQRMGFAVKDAIALVDGRQTDGLS